MGVPAFYKWLVTKYPKVVSDCIEDRPTWNEAGEKVPVDTSRANPNGVEFDNLFLDMNGIIHPASHPEDRPPPETEDDMNLAVTDYLERVFAAARPRKLLFMAIDGVAPRAKMNQQRARRFRSAQEAAEKEAEEERLRGEWEAEGREVPARKEGRAFDSNVITPGTPFMDRLAQHLRAFIHLKLSTDPGWRGIKVVLSDGSVPGEGERQASSLSLSLSHTHTHTETASPPSLSRPKSPSGGGGAEACLARLPAATAGEHKIMEYIRQQRLSPDYDPNTRHALHGQRRSPTAPWPAARP